MTKITDAAAASVASGASKPSAARRRPMIRLMARAPTRSGASAIRPCGASVALNAATMIATAVGANRWVAIVRSTSAQTVNTPRAISGSGRRPLLNGSQAARKTIPPVATAIRFRDRPPIPDPRRGRTRWLRISQLAIAAAVAGSRIHTPAVLTEANCASTDWYQSNGASVAPK